MHLRFIVVMPSKEELHTSQPEFHGMTPFSSLDSLLVSQVDFDRYNGHHRLEYYELPSRPDAKWPQPVDLSTSAQAVAQFIREPGPWKDGSTPTMKLVMIQTRNQSTARRLSAGGTSPAKMVRTGRPDGSERQKHCDFVQDLFAITGLPLAAFGSYIKGHITFVCTPSSLPNDEGATAYYCSGTSWTITWIHYANLSHTAVVLFHREGDGDDRRSDFLDELIRLQEHLGHPMLPGYIKTKISIWFTFDMLDDMNSETLELEQDVGFPTWNWILDRETPGKQEIPESHDHAVGRFNVLSGKLTNIRFRLRTFQQQIKFISRCNKRYMEAMNPCTGQGQHRASLSDHIKCESPGGNDEPEDSNDARGGNQPNLHPARLSLDDTLNIIWDYTAIHLFDADTLAERLRNQMESIFQITAQRDSRANLAIADINNKLAWQGRESNSAMMTIAFVSLLFLPGTFVASVFGMMTGFDSDSGSSSSTLMMTSSNSTAAGTRMNATLGVDKPVKNDRLMVYWVTTGLLTVILCLAWILYLRRRRKIVGRHKELAVRGANERIYKRGVGVVGGANGVALVDGLMEEGRMGNAAVIHNREDVGLGLRWDRKTTIEEKNAPPMPSPASTWRSRTWSMRNLWGTTAAKN